MALFLNADFPLLKQNDHKDMDLNALFGDQDCKGKVDIE